MRNIVLYPDPVLRKKTEKIRKIDLELEREVSELAEVLEKSTNGAGLAAPQIGISKRFFGLKVAKDKKVQVLINPEIDGVYGELDWIKMKIEGAKEGEKKEEDFLEGCLSFPNLYGTVKRYLKIKARWQEIREGRLVTQEGTLRGFEAIVYQHELDHLNGILLIDHLKAEGGKLFWQDGERVEEVNPDKIRSLGWENIIVQSIKT